MTHVILYLSQELKYRSTEQIKLSLSHLVMFIINTIQQIKITCVYLKKYISTFISFWMDIGKRKMIVWHSFFSYLHLTLRRGKERETQMVFWLRGSCLSFCKGLLLSFPIWKCRTIWEGKADIIFSLHSLTPHALEEREQRKQDQDSRSFCKIHIPSARFAFLFPTVEALPFALVVLTLNPKLFWYETCLLCVNVCFV